MLKATQILGSCASGLVWKPRYSGGLSFISVPTKPLSYSSSSRRVTGTNSSFLLKFPARGTRCLRPFHAPSARSESNPDGGSASSIAVQPSAVSFSGSTFLSIWRARLSFFFFLRARWFYWLLSLIGNAKFLVREIEYHYDSFYWCTWSVHDILMQFLLVYFFRFLYKEKEGLVMKSNIRG